MSSSLPFIDTNINLTLQEINILRNGRKYITPCQSRFSRQSKDKLIQKEYERILNATKRCLNNNHTSATDQRAKQAFQELEQIIKDLYSKPLSSKLYRRARREHRIVKRLQRLLRSRPDIIVRRIDKGEGFYFGNKTTMEQKTEEYMKKTEAYQEVTKDHCRLVDILHSTETLLDYLLQKKVITKDRHRKLLPNVDKMELAYLYTLPKIHKVILL